MNSKQDQSKQIHTQIHGKLVRTDTKGKLSLQPRGVGWGGRREGGSEGGDIGIPMADSWQKPIQLCKAIILQLKVNNFFKKEIYPYQDEEVKVKVLVAQSYLSLCSSMDCNLPVSSVHGFSKQEY